MLLPINPKVDFDYVYNVPDDPSCRHLLVSPAQSRFQRNTGRQRHGGCSVKGERPPRPQSNGDLDLLLRPFEPAKGNEYVEVTLLQQIPYACFDDQKPPQIQKDSQGRFICNDGRVGVVEDLSPQFGAPGVWIGLGRYMLINGGKIRSS